MQSFGGNEQVQKQTQQRFQQTGSPHGIMQPEELVAATTQKWEQVRNKVSIQDRQEFEPYLEALLGRVQASSQIQQLTSS